MPTAAVQVSHIHVKLMHHINVRTAALVYMQREFQFPYPGYSVTWFCLHKYKCQLG